MDPPKPVSSFGHLGFDETMINAIIKAGYSTPTPIQAQVRIANIEWQKLYSYPTG